MLFDIEYEVEVECDYGCIEDGTFSVGNYFSALRGAGFLRHVGANMSKHVTDFLSSSEYATVDELMALLWLDKETDYAREARKYTLGYFGGSGSINVKLENLDVEGLVGEVGIKQKRDEDGR